MARSFRLFFTKRFVDIFECYLNLKIVPSRNFNSRHHGVSLVKKIQGPIPLYDKRDHEYRILSRKAAVQTLEQLLGLKTFDALQIVMDYPSYQHVSKHKLTVNYNLLSQNQIPHETIQKYPELLTVTDLQSKLKKALMLPYKINDTAILLTLSMGEFMKLSSRELLASENERKILTLASSLQVDIQKACEFIKKKPFLINISSDKIKNNINLLLSYGITTEEVSNDLCVLNYSEELIRTRLSFAKENNIDTLKTWMVRAKHEIFQMHIQRQSENKSILGDNSLVEYLSERLECSVATASYIILKQPALKNKSLKKIKELLDFLYGEGFHSHQICRVPKILVHSVETTRKRLKELNENGIRIDGLSMLTKSQNQYRQYYEALLKSKCKSKTKS